MPKFPTFPTLFDNTLRLSVSDLKRMGYLSKGRRRAGSINWGSGRTSASIKIEVDMTVPQPYLEFDYSHYERPIRYRVRLVNIPSNLGKGHVWYFVCPNTQKRCRILYGIDGYFLHREAFPEAMYERQTRSASSRGLGMLVDFVFDEPPKKRYYKGKPTRRYMRWMSKRRCQKAGLLESGILETSKKRAET